MISNQEHIVKVINFISVPKVRRIQKLALH